MKISLPLDEPRRAVPIAMRLGCCALTATILALAPAGQSRADSLRINEILASNQTILDDEDGDSSDWIEIENPTDAPADLGGMFLTDDPLDLRRWEFPAGLILDPHGFLLVFASGKDRDVLGGELHANFELSGAGEYLALVAADGVTVVQDFSPAFPRQESDVSYGVDGRYFLQPSPGRLNQGRTVTGFVADTRFSVDRGIFDGPPFTVEITTATPDATIIYTTDSSTPTLRNGTRVEGSSASVRMAKTTVLRAVALKDGLSPTNIDTQTYLFPLDVASQSDNPTTYRYPRWDNLQQARSADYGMDRDEIAGPLYSRREVAASLVSLPTISIATDIENLFDRETGNYSNSYGTGTEWEREVSMELFGFAHGKKTQLNGGLRLAGNASRNPNRHKHNMRIVFRGEYGAGTLEFPLFDDSGVTIFNSIQLRGGNGDSWVHPGIRGRATYLRDQWHRDAHRAMGGTSQVQRYAHLYLNGMYWGVYHVFERIEDDYMVRHLGGKESDWDVRDHISAFDGTEAAWQEVFAIADHPGGMADPRNYSAIQDQLHLPGFVDWLLVHFYSNSDDWDQNNVRMARNRTGGWWSFYCWDQERSLLNSLSSPNVNGSIAIDKNTTSRRGPTHVHQQLMQNPEYRLLFADRVRKHCFHRGALTPETASALWDARAEELRPAMIAESARWGDLHGNAIKPADWELRVQAEKDGWFARRDRLLIGLLQIRGLYPEVEAPEFGVNGSRQHGGPTGRGAKLSLTAPRGTIYYTLDGSDPRLPRGIIAGVEYREPLELTGPVRVKARVLAGRDWSALTEAHFSPGEQARAGNLVISKIMYHPETDPQAEFIELMNISRTEGIDLSRVRFTAGIDFEFPENTVLDAEARALVVRDLAAFESSYGTELPVLGTFANGTALDNKGQRLRLEDARGEIIQDFRYGDDGGWPEGADGGGWSLVLMSPQLDPDPARPSSWRTSVETGGSPGFSDAVPFAEWGQREGAASVFEDLDRDALAAGIEYALGLDPQVAEAHGHPVPSLIDHDGVPHLGVSFTRVTGRDDALLGVEVSSDLVAWERGGTELVSNTRRMDGSETLIYRRTGPLSDEEQLYLRLVATFPEGEP